MNKETMRAMFASLGGKEVRFNVELIRRTKQDGGEGLMGPPIMTTEKFEKIEYALRLRGVAEGTAIYEVVSGIVEVAGEGSLPGEVSLEELCTRN